MWGCSRVMGTVHGVANQFPTYVGMFLKPTSFSRLVGTIPNVCGDVP